MTRAVVLAALLAAAPLAAGCGPWLYAASTPPPGSIANLDTEAEHAVLGQGTVLAFRCADTGPCKGARAVSDDPSIAEVRPAALAQLTPDVWRGMQPEATFVLVARAPGHTRVRVTSADGDVDLRVTVLAAP